ncbi:hypothetical protein ACFYWX_04340 [Streptomyces sp. NPDC002888]|uniref:hypothetical protein n=1 Tax=Streptomyces sp. NPDC002888 TaxID=3364668 RepID=UPI00367C95FD
MRVSKQLSTAMLLLALSATAVSCDDGDGGGTEQGGSATAGSGAASGAVPDAGADGDGRSGTVSGLGKASDMDGLVQLVNSATLCEGVSQKTEDVLFYFDEDDKDDEGRDRAALIAASNEKFSLKARAICRGESWADNVHELMLIDDMAKFQAAYKDYQRADGETDTEYYVGQDFAVMLNARDSQKVALVRAGTLGLNCSPNFVPPAGYRNEPAQVDGCLLTDYVD